MNKNSNLVTLIVLGVIWSSFALFTKICAEVLSPCFISFSRLALAFIMLYWLCLFQGKKVFVAQNFKYYAVIGFFNSASPFTLFAFASKNLDSGVMAILDGTVSIFELLISIFFLKRLVSKNAILGAALGIFGIAMTYLSNGLALEFTGPHFISVTSILLATFSFAVASIYLNENCKAIDAVILATGSVCFATLIFSPILFFTDYSVINLRTTWAMLGLGLICTGGAYILYFKLLTEESPRVAVSVALIIPILGVIFGAVFLGEELTLNKIVGCVAILISVKFVLNISWKNFSKS
jgi:drug/metabolite transporter (DMT)-like permease